MEMSAAQRRSTMLENLRRLLAIEPLTSCRGSNFSLPSRQDCTRRCLKDSCGRFQRPWNETVHFPWIAAVSQLIAEREFQQILECTAGRGLPY